MIETFSDFQAQGMTEGFYLSENSLLRQGFRLASARAQVLDYVFVAGGTEQGITEDQFVPIYQRIDRPQNGDAKAGGILSMNLQGGLNFENLTELVSGRGGIAPAVTFDLMSTPPVGDSGSTPVTIELSKFRIWHAADGDDSGRVGQHRGRVYLNGASGIELRGEADFTERSGIELMALQL